MNAMEKTAGIINFPTSRFGPLAITEDKIICFAHGLPGFEKLKRFILIDHDPEGSFKWLQAVDNPMVAFLLTNPNAYQPDYAVPLKKSEMESLGARDADALITLVMVSVAGSERTVSLNLRAPLVFNSANMRAMQCVIEREDYISNFIIRAGQ